MKRSRKIVGVVITVSLLCLIARPGSADIFVLGTGGEVRGELINADQSPRSTYVIGPYAGGEITLAASLVTRVIQQKPVEVEYEKLRARQKDTVRDHWLLAEWCQKNRLNLQRQKHLERMIELDSDHAEARRLLGYDLVDGRWMTRDQVMIDRGYVKYNGRWILPQQAKLLEQRKTQKAAEQSWYEKVRRWHSWLSGSKAARGKEYLQAITSPDAVPALIKNLESADKYSYKEIFAEALANVGSRSALAALIEYTIEDDDEDFRYFCLELLEKTRPPIAAGIYVKALQSKDNRIVNRAGIGLSMLGDKSVVGPLIDALITEHKFTLGKGSPGQMTTTFGGGTNNRGTSFGSGGGPRVVKRHVRNEEVLGALARLTGKDFDFDVETWKRWYATQKPAEPKVNTRRDDG